MSALATTSAARQQAALDAAAVGPLLNLADRCRVELCTGVLEFRKDAIGRMVDVCRDCAARVRILRDTLRRMGELADALRLAAPQATALATMATATATASAPRGAAVAGAVRTYKPKPCRRCLAMFAPVGPRQLDCETCFSPDTVRRRRRAGIR